MNKKQVLAAGGAAAVSILIAFPAFAATTSPSPTSSTAPSAHHWKGAKPAVRGKVAAINGDTITVTAKNGTTYTVDATNATVKKGYGKTATTIAVSSIAVNDTVAVRGTLSGDDVTATAINDGVPTHTAGNHHQKLANATFGTVTSVNGSTITLSRMMRTGSTTPATTSIVTVETTSSTVYKKNGQADTASDLAVGQRIVAMGTKDSSGNITDATSVNIFTGTPRERKTVTTTSASS
jgi:hypothetical protein